MQQQLWPSQWSSSSSTTLDVWRHAQIHRLALTSFSCFMSCDEVKFLDEARRKAIFMCGSNWLRTHKKAAVVLFKIILAINIVLRVTEVKGTICLLNRQGAKLEALKHTTLSQGQSRSETRPVQVWDNTLKSSGSSPGRLKSKKALCTVIFDHLTYILLTFMYKSTIQYATDNPQLSGNRIYFLYSHFVFMNVISSCNQYTFYSTEGTHDKPEKSKLKNINVPVDGLRTLSGAEMWPERIGPMSNVFLVH